ncbi:MAG: hypothetical protein IPJ21_10475 [Sterolibacteriaceae bacterium]|nr:hypothetical protein [Sterolibacteriaceae bacterium]MBK9084285.1 hypothetical protein [Sterolibacteriaceae bacterium]
MEQLKPMLTYNHLLEISEADRRLTIHRIYSDGRKELFTQVILPNTTCDEDPAKFEEFCRLLGENLLIDSPIASKLLGL